MRFTSQGHVTPKRALADLNFVVPEPVNPESGTASAPAANEQPDATEPASMSDELVSMTES